MVSSDFVEANSNVAHFEKKLWDTLFCILEMSYAYRYTQKISRFLFIVLYVEKILRPNEFIFFY